MPVDPRITTITVIFRTANPSERRVVTFSPADVKAVVFDSDLRRLIPEAEFPPRGTRPPEVDMSEDLQPSATAQGPLACYIMRSALRCW